MSVAGYLYEGNFDGAWIMSWSHSLPDDNPGVRNVTPIDEEVAAIEDSEERAAAMLPEWKTDPTEDEMVWLQIQGDNAHNSVVRS